MAGEIEQKREPIRKDHPPGSIHGTLGYNTTDTSALDLYRGNPLIEPDFAVFFDMISEL